MRAEKLKLLVNKVFFQKQAMTLIYHTSQSFTKFSTLLVGCWLPLVKRTTSLKRKLRSSLTLMTPSLFASAFFSVSHSSV
jgi:hypothetical protein